MRRMKTPPWWRANAQLNSAVRAPPTCRWPVGLGAKRTRTGSLMGIGSGTTAYSTRSEAEAPHQRARQAPDDEHDDPPDGRRVDYRTPARHRPHHGLRHRVRLSRERRHGEARRHPRLDEARLDADDGDAAVGVGVAEPLEEGGEAGLGGAVEVVAAPRPVPRHGAERADGAAAPPGEPLGGHLAEHGGAGE